MNSKSIRVGVGVVLALIAVFVFPKLRSAETSEASPSPTTIDGATTASKSTSDTANTASSKTTSKSAAAKSSGDSATSAEPKLGSSTMTSSTKQAAANTTTKSTAKSTASSIGFTTRQHWQEHFEKHGAEFGDVTKDEYLSLAQTLRDSPIGGNVLEAVRDDGTVSRFDKKSGAFLAFNRDKTIRTFFKPNDGVRYFERQIEKDH